MEIFILHHSIYHSIISALKIKPYTASDRNRYLMEGGYKENLKDRKYSARQYGSEGLSPKLLGINMLVSDDKGLENV